MCGVSSFQKRQTCNFLIKCYCKIGRRRKYAMIRGPARCARCTYVRSPPTTVFSSLGFLSFVFASAHRIRGSPDVHVEAEVIAWCRHAAHLSFYFCLNALCAREHVINIYAKRRDDHNVIKTQNGASFYFPFDGFYRKSKRQINNRIYAKSSLTRSSPYWLLRLAPRCALAHDII